MKNLENIKKQDIATVMGNESRTVAIIFLHEDFNKGDERTGLRQLANNLFGFAKIYCCKGSVFNTLAEPQEQEIGAVISFPNNPPVILSKQSIERPASDAISYSHNTRRLYTRADGCITSAINITDFVITEYKNLLEGTAPDIEKSYYRQISDRIWELKNIAAMQLERKKSIEEMVKESHDQIGISDDAINRIETMEKEVENNSGSDYAEYKAVLSGVRKFLEKGRLLLLLHNDINSDSKDEKYPMSLLQPIACAFEICDNLLLYRLEGENYYIIKQTENECGKILKYMRKYHWRKVERIDDILRKARLCRNNSSHPNIMLLLHDIDGSEKAKLYRAIEEISKLLHGKSIYFFAEKMYNRKYENRRIKKGDKNFKEPRRTGYGNIRHKLEDIIIIGLCTVICGGEDFADMEAFGKSRQEYLGKFLELPNGIPDSDTFRRVFEKLDPSELSSCLIDWVAAERAERGVGAIDGKTICGSANAKHKAYHVISAFAAENQLTLGELTVEEKTNEITAVPELLNLIDVKGSIVTANAMSCQKKIVETITEKKADYVIGLKQNQPALYEDTEDYFNEFYKAIPSTTTLDKGHGRIEKREYRLLTELSRLEQRSEWIGLKALGSVKSTITEKGETHEFTRYFITSLTDLNEFSYSVQKHWAIENQLHWCLDVIFREDASRARKAPCFINPINGLAERWEDKIFLTSFLSGNTGKVKFLAVKIYLCQSGEIKSPTSNFYLCSSVG